MNANQVLSTYPLTRLRQLNRVDAAGNVTPAGVAAGTVKNCNAAGVCGYYQYLQGTSMSAKVESLLLRTAAEHACPEPRLFSYANVGRPAEFNALCEGDLNFNGFYGYGILDTFAAVTAPPAWGELP